MTATPEALERQLEADLDRLFAALADDASSTELYRALCSTRWGRDGADGHVALSWTRAAVLIDELRERHGRAPLDLAHTGGEGTVSHRVAEVLREAGWHGDAQLART